MLDKIKSCLLGGMLGDAYGNRFSSMDVPTRDEIWKFSDATSLTVATCESILEEGKVDPRAVAEKFAQYYREDKLKGMSPSTLRSLILLSMGKSRRSDGSGLDGSAVNSSGAAMRIAPLAYLLDPHEPADLAIIQDVCSITDEGSEAFAGALAVLLALRLVNNDKQNFIPPVIRLLPDSEVREKLTEISRSPDMHIRKLLLQRERGDHAAEIVPIALLAAQQSATSGVRSVWRSIVSSGRDTATICSIAGQIAGAFISKEEFPTDWMEKLESAEDFASYQENISGFNGFVSSKFGVSSLF